MNTDRKVQFDEDTEFIKTNDTADKAGLFLVSKGDASHKLISLVKRFLYDYTILIKLLKIQTFDHRFDP